MSQPGAICGSGRPLRGCARVRAKAFAHHGGEPLLAAQFRWVIIELLSRRTTASCMTRTADEPCARECCGAHHGV